MSCSLQVSFSGEVTPFESPQGFIQPDVAAYAFQIDYRGSHKLPRPVIGDIPAPLDLENLHASAFEFLQGKVDVGRVAPRPQGQHRRVLQQKQGVVNLARNSPLKQTALDVERPVVWDYAKPDYVYLHISIPASRRNSTGSKPRPVALLYHL